MRASLFFRVLKSGRTIYTKDRNSFVLDLCNVATIPINIKNHKTFTEHYRERVYGKKKSRALDLRDEKTAHILASAFWASSPIRRH